MLVKQDRLTEPIQHIEVKSFDARPVVAAMGRLALQARNLHRVAQA